MQFFPLWFSDNFFLLLHISEFFRRQFKELWFVFLFLRKVVSASSTEIFTDRFIWLNLCIDKFIWLNLCIDRFIWLNLCTDRFIWLSLCIDRFIWLNLCIGMFIWLTLCIDRFICLNQWVDRFLWLNLWIDRFVWLNLWIDRFIWLNLKMWLVYMTDSLNVASVLLSSRVDSQWLFSLELAEAAAKVTFSKDYSVSLHVLVEILLSFILFLMNRTTLFSFHW